VSATSDSFNTTMTMDPITIEVPKLPPAPPPSAATAGDKAALPPNGRGIGMMGHTLPEYKRQKSSSSTEESRRSRLIMPLAYRMYESQNEELRGTIAGPEDEEFHPEDASKALRQALSAGIRKLGGWLRWG